jgi:L,D-peptidoglycan transpeptidase YkuD (ErfK/YbiS/YcfS/YnhG family)
MRTPDSSHFARQGKLRVAPVRRLRFPAALAVALTVVITPFMGAPHAAAADLPADATVVRQLITVTAASYGTSHATLRAYRISGTKRILLFGPWTARVGYNGIARPGRKREGDGKTPSGTYGFSFFFGVDLNPGVVFPYRRAYRYDYWDDDPASPRYNLWVDIRRASAGRRPEPMHNVPAYNYAAVIAYNTARAPGLGSAIFLHVGTGGSTAGCVSLPTAELLKILRWLRPADAPRITITVR